MWYDWQARYVRDFRTTVFDWSSAETEDGGETEQEASDREYRDYNNCLSHGSFQNIRSILHEKKKKVKGYKMREWEV